jgi:demethylmenaquinone methyltransferase/2-methoxy-6-polyprenyl-1,4-benzoquinol methylase
MFDRIARRYSLVNSLTSFGLDRHWRRAAVQLAAAQPTDRLLDVCCGTGDLADAFAEIDPHPAEIVATDFSPRMIAAAQARQSLRARPITLLQADATALPWPDASFDIVSCGFGLRNVSDPARALTEFFRVLRPGGRVVILEFGLPSQPVLRAMFRVYFHLALPAIGGLVSGDFRAYRYLPRSVERFFSAGQVADMVKAAGFADVRQQLLTHGVAAVTVGTRR